MGMFFREQKIKDEEPVKAEPGSEQAPPNGNYRLGMNLRDGEMFIDSLCVDGTNLIERIPDNPELPEGQVFLVHPMGLIDYNQVVDYYTGGNSSAEQ